MPIYPILSLDLKLTDARWAFADKERARIDAHWASLAADNRRIWNGDILICVEARIAGEELVGRFARSDFAAMIAWRDSGWPDKSARNCFGSAVILSADGAVIYGKMAGHTLNAGRIYPPGGSLEPSDVDENGRVDVLGSIARELKEETGLNRDEARAEGLLAVFDGQRLSIAQLLRFPLTARAIEDRITEHVAADPEAELAGAVVLWSRTQIDPAIPGYAQEIARHIFPLPPRRGERESG